MATKLEVYQTILDRGDYDKIPEDKRKIVDALVSKGVLTMGTPKPQPQSQEVPPTPTATPATLPTEDVRSRLNPQGDGVFGPQGFLSDAIGMGKAAVGDVGELIEGYKNLAAHPIQSADMIGGIPLGAIQTLIPGDQGKYEQSARDLGSHYGKLLTGALTTGVNAILPKSVEGMLPQYMQESAQYFNKESAENPLKTLLDVSPVAGAKGMKAASLVDPAVMAVRGLKSSRKLMPEIIEKKLMSSAVRPEGPLSKQNKTVELMLKNKLGTTEKRTLIPAEKRLNEIYEEVDKNVLSGAKAGEKVDLAKIINEAFDEEINLHRHNLGSTDSVEKLEALREKVLDKYGKEVPLDEALKFRRATDKSLNRFWRNTEKGKSGFDFPEQLDVTGKIANKLRGEINKYSNNANLNKEASELLKVIPAIERKIVQGRNAKLMPFGVGELVAGTKAMGGQTSKAMMMISLMKALEASPVKAAMARKARSFRTPEPAKVGRYQALTQAALKREQLQKEKEKEK